MSKIIGLMFILSCIVSAYAQQDSSYIYGGIAKNKGNGERIIANCIASEGGICSMFKFYLLEPTGLPNELVDFQNLRPFVNAKYSTLAIKEIIRDYRDNTSLNKLINFLILRQNFNLSDKFSDKDFYTLKNTLEKYKEVGVITTPEKMSWAKEITLPVINQYGLTKIEKYGLDILKNYSTQLALVDNYGINNVRLYGLKNLELYGLNQCEGFVQNIGKKYLDNNSIILIHFETSELEVLAKRLSKTELAYFAKLVDDEKLTKMAAMERFTKFSKLAAGKLVKFTGYDSKYIVIEVRGIDLIYWKLPSESTIHNSNPILPKLLKEVIQSVE